MEEFVQKITVRAEWLRSEGVERKKERKTDREGGRASRIRAERRKTQTKKEKETGGDN